MGTKSESQIQAEIMLALSNAGHRVWRSNAGSVRNEQGYTIKLFPKGFSDLIGVRKGDAKTFFIEVKNEKGRLRPEQAKFLKFMDEFGAITGVCRSAEEALELVEKNKPTN